MASLTKLGDFKYCYSIAGSKSEPVFVGNLTIAKLLLQTQGLNSIFYLHWPTGKTFKEASKILQQYETGWKTIGPLRLEMAWNLNYSIG